MSTVQLKRSAVASKVPVTADVALGELALNTYDGRLFFKKDSGTPAIVTVVTTADTQTLTNKTLTAAVMSGNTAFNTDTLFVDSTNGRVGIGTSSPAQKLEVSGSGVQTIRVITTDTSGTNIGRFLAEYTGGGGGVASQIDIRAGAGYTYINTSSNTPMLFSTNSIERMRIDSSGNVGIGTSSPSTLLTVDGGGYTQTNYAATPLIRMQYAEGTKAAPTAVSTQSITGLVSGRGRDELGVYRDTTQIYFFSDGAVSSTSAPGFLLFSTTPTGSISPLERMRITASGNVGIGGIVPSYALEVSGVTKSIAVTGTGNPSFYAISSDAAGIPFLILQNGSYSWQNRNNGTTGDLSWAVSGSKRECKKAAGVASTMRSASRMMSLRLVERFS
jgi:hypothetical protein